jgi:ArsR family transcriptional regulator
MTIRENRMFRALAHEKRRQVLAWLKAPAAHFPPQVDGDLVRDGVCVLRIAEKLGVRQPTATRHLQILADAGLVTATRIGKWTFFRRNETAIGRLKSELIEKV